MSHCSGPRPCFFENYEVEIGVEHCAGNPLFEALQLARNQGCLLCPGDFDPAGDTRMFPFTGLIPNSKISDSLGFYKVSFL